MEKLDCVVIGAGVIGLAVARALSMGGREVFILEKTEGIGNQASSRNSEVIHAGMYYSTGSKKARFCVSGGIELYSYCERKNIGHRKIGKLIVAKTGTDLSRLENLARQAKINQVVEFRMLNRAETLALEPALDVQASLYSPRTGIIDSHGLLEAFRRDAEEHGAMIAFDSPVLRGFVKEKGIRLDIGGHEPLSVLCRTVINCAGVDAENIARSIEGFPEAFIPKTYMCKGNYFVFPGKHPFSRLVYTVPEKVSLGIHLTLDLAGKARFGPDAQWVTKLDYTVDEGRAEMFFDAVRKFWPDLPPGSLVPGYSGIRAVLRKGPDDDPADFLIQGPGEHGVPGIVNLFGIDSPGLTSSMAIAREVVRILGDNLELE